MKWTFTGFQIEKVGGFPIYQQSETVLLLSMIDDGHSNN